MCTMSERVVLKSRVDKPLRKRFRMTSIEEECSYEELFELLLDFKEEHPEAWETFRQGSPGRRPSGSGR